MKQAAVAGADDSAVDMADPVTERNGTADNRDQPEDGNDAGSLTADDSESGKLVNGAKANASAVSVFYYSITSCCLRLFTILTPPQSFYLYLTMHYAPTESLRPRHTLHSISTLHIHQNVVGLKTSLHPCASSKNLVQIHRYMRHQLPKLLVHEAHIFNCLGQAS